MNAWQQHRVLRHLLYWTAVSAFFMLIQLPDDLLMGQALYWRDYVFCTLPMMVLTIYPLVYGLLPRLLRGHHVAYYLVLLAGWLIGCDLLAGALQALTTHFLIPWVFQQVPASAFHWSEVTNTVRFGFLATVFVGGGACAAKMYHSWYEQQLLSRRLLQSKLHAELELLKAQLQPVFLFNTLHTLRELTARNSPDAPGAVLQLAALLRYLLYEREHETVPLADEVEMIRNYVTLEKLRLGARLEVSLAFNGPIHSQRIAPLLLLPFVENAFRHGTAAGGERPWVSIDLVAKSNALRLKVINSRWGPKLPAAVGPELDRLRQRLEHLYPARHTLKTVTEPDTFLVTLSLQLTPPVLVPPLQVAMLGSVGQLTY